MGSADEVEVGALQELGDDVGAEGERHTAVALTPPLGIRVRVRPQEVAGQPSVRDLRRPLDLPQLLQGLQLGGKACATARRTLALSGLRATWLGHLWTYRRGHRGFSPRRWR